MLFEVEKLFWSCPILSATEYLQRSGALEQLILGGMQRLRSVLDVTPYRPGSWTAEMDETVTRNSAIVQAECMLYMLWRQFFVAGAYYSSLLTILYEVPVAIGPLPVPFAISFLTGHIVQGDTPKRYRERWKLWCTAMRFEHFGEKVRLVKSLRLDEDRPHFYSAAASLRAAVIQTMLDECQPEDVKLMWDLRRTKPTSAILVEKTHNDFGGNLVSAP